jgi:hypothetical protein
LYQQFGGIDVENRKWIMHRDPANKFAAKFTLGSREIELPPDAIVSLTLGDRFTIWRTILNGILTQFIKRQLVKAPGLLYAELDGDMQTGSSLTMTVWEAKSMVPFRDSGAHKIAKQFFSWVFYSGKTQVYFLTFAAKGRIPSTEEGYALARQFGRHFDGGMEQRPARPPRAWYEELAGD